MNVCYSMGKTCKICGSKISDNNTTGVGCECRYSYNKARKTVFFDDKERSLAYFKIEVDNLMKIFIKFTEGMKFRSKFKKSFVPSVIEQYKEKGFLSRKQLETCSNIINWNLCDYETYYVHKQEMQQLMIKNFQPSEQEEEKIVNLANKFRHEFRKNQ